MRPLTKTEKRRENLLDEYWFKKYGNPEKPSAFTRMTRKHLGIR